VSASLRRAAVAALVLPLGACDWFTDFKDQPRIEPWESYALADTAGVLDTAAAARIPYRGQPVYSVPTSGRVAPALAVSYFPAPPQLDSMAALLTNPVAADSASLERGRKHYQINCAVCHGLDGAGRGPATYYGMPAIAINGAQTQGYADGYIFGIIRNGRGLMPTYNRIEEMERWDVVNYVRGLQGRYAVPTTPPPVPGEGGASVPGASMTAPTVPSPYTTLRRAAGDSAVSGGAPILGAPGTRPTTTAPAGDTTGAAGAAGATATDTTRPPGGRD
jgi:mono/diheme cytochrome c family protein